MPVPTRKELLVDFGLNVSHSVIRVRLARPDLFERFLALEQEAAAEAKRRITALVQANIGEEYKVSADIRALAQAYGIGIHTLCRWRKEARGGKQERAAWDWPRVMRLIKDAVRAKDPDIISLAVMAQRIGPEYHISGTGNLPLEVMSKNTLYSKLLEYPELYKKFRELCVRNLARKRTEKESK